MFTKISTWLWSNRKPISYSLAGLNVLLALTYLALGDYGLAVLWAVISGMFIYDAATLDQE